MSSEPAASLPSPLLTPQLVALRERMAAAALVDVLIVLTSIAHGPLTAALGGALLVAAAVIWGGPRRYLDLVPWYGWTHAAAAAGALWALVTADGPAGAPGSLDGAAGLATWTLAVGGAAVATAVLPRYRPAGAALWRERDVEVRTWGGWTFERLSAASPGVLGSIVDRGLGPVPRDLAGWEYRGFHLHPLARLFRVTKSTLGFFDSAGSRALEGYRRGTAQDGEERPWRTTEPARRYGFFVATPADVAGRNKHPTATALDYEASRRNPSDDPLRRRITYAVMANSGDPTLLVGKVYFRVTPALVVPLGFVILERWRPHSFDGAGA